MSKQLVDELLCKCLLPFAIPSELMRCEILTWFSVGLMAASFDASSDEYNLYVGMHGLNFLIELSWCVSYHKRFANSCGANALEWFSTAKTSAIKIIEHSGQNGMPPRVHQVLSN